MERVPGLEGREGEWKGCDFVQRQPVVVVELLMSSELVRLDCRAGSLKSSILWNSWRWNRQLLWFFFSSGWFLVLPRRFFSLNDL